MIIWPLYSNLLIWSLSYEAWEEFLVSQTRQFLCICWTFVHLCHVGSKDHRFIPPLSHSHLGICRLKILILFEWRCPELKSFNFLAVVMLCRNTYKLEIFTKNWLPKGIVFSGSLLNYIFFFPSGWFWSFSYKHGKSFLLVRFGHFYAYADLSCTFAILAQEIHRFLPPLSHSHLDSTWFLTGVFVNWLESMWAGVSPYFWLIKFDEYSFSLRV